MPRARSVSVLLLDGNPDGWMKAKMEGWNGVIYKIPRSSLCAHQEEIVNHSGCYFLFGKLNGRDAVYVGQANDLLRRFRQHDSRKPFWTDAVALTATDNSFGNTEISFFEATFFGMANDAGRYVLENNQIPSSGNITEERSIALESHVDNVKLILGAIGYKLFTPLTESERNVLSNDEEAAVSTTPAQSHVKPELPDASLKVGAFVRLAMHNLADSGYTFSVSQIVEMCTSEWSTEHFHSKHPFMRLVVESMPKDTKIDGNVRFWTDVYDFGGGKVLITKEWYEDKAYRRSDFISWYNAL